MSQYQNPFTQKHLKAEALSSKFLIHKKARVLINVGGSVTELIRAKRGVKVNSVTELIRAKRGVKGNSVTELIRAKRGVRKRDAS